MKTVKYKYGKEDIVFFIYKDILRQGIVQAVHISSGKNDEMRVRYTVSYKENGINNITSNEELLGSTPAELWDIHLEMFEANDKN